MWKIDFGSPQGTGAKKTKKNNFKKEVGETGQNENEMIFQAEKQTKTKKLKLKKN